MFFYKKLDLAKKYGSNLVLVIKKHKSNLQGRKPCGYSFRIL